MNYVSIYASTTAVFQLYSQGTLTLKINAFRAKQPRKGKDIGTIRKAQQMSFQALPKLKKGFDFHTTQKSKKTGQAQKRKAF